MGRLKGSFPPTENIPECPGKYSEIFWKYSWMSTVQDWLTARVRASMMSIWRTTMEPRWTWFADIFSIFQYMTFHTINNVLLNQTPFQISQNQSFQIYSKWSLPKFCSIFEYVTLAYQQCFANFSNFSGAHHSLVCEEVLHREPCLQVRLLLPLHPPHRPPHPRSCRQNLHQVRSIVSSWVILALNSLKSQILWANIDREFYTSGFLLHQNVQRVKINYLFIL